MVLIPEEKVAQLTHLSNDRTIQTPGTALSRLDEEMLEILNSNKFADEREKCKVYLQALQRYLYFVEEAKRNIPTKTTNTSIDAVYKTTQSRYSEDEEVNKPGKDCLDDLFILDSVPLKYRPKARLLLNHMHFNASNRLTWDKYGVISIDSVKINESNIVDLINDAMRARKVPNPVGRQHFATFMRSVKVPREFIGNQNFWLNSPVNNNMLQVPNNSSTHGAGHSRGQSDSSELPTDDTDTVSEYASADKWESLSPKKKKQRSRI